MEIIDTTEENRKRKNDLSNTKNLIKKVLGCGFFKRIKKIRTSPYCVYADTKLDSVISIHPGLDTLYVHDRNYINEAKQIAETYESVMGRPLKTFETDFS